MGWDGWIFAPAGADAYERKYATAIVTDFATNMTNGIEGFDFDRDYPRLKSELAPILDATDPDLTAFNARGGKLILWHGWADPALPPEHTIDYFQAVRTRLGPERTSRSIRLFMIPGMQHCIGGPGANSFGQLTSPVQPADPHADVAAALERWVEGNAAPEELIGHHATNPFAGALDWRQADPHKEYLLCAYPRVAVLKANRDPAMASSYRCAKPVS
jgi:feruloyl esterase